MVRADIVKLNNELEGVKALEKIIACVHHGATVQITANGVTYNIVAENEIYKALVARVGAINNHFENLSLTTT